MGRVDMSKKYHYRNGRPAQVLCIDRDHPEYPVVSMTEDGTLITHDVEGYVWDKDHKEMYDLIEDNPYASFQIDEPVMVRDDCDSAWTKRHFAGVDSEGRPMTWACGMTSWTASNNKTMWKECRRPTKGERLY